MITKKEFPILEFDTEKVAKINPENLFPEKFSADKMIISFFPEAINRLIKEKQIEVYCHIGGENPFDIYKFVDAPDVLLILGQVGCPACAGNLDALQAGCIAVAQCRGFDYGALIYGGDDVASEEWNSRGWNTRQGIRYNLILLCKELVQEI